jgi:hypothetical protein
VGVELSRKGGRRRWCGFNASDSAREGKRQDKSLLEDEAETKERWHRVGEGREETMSVGLTRILLSHKMKKIQAVDSVAINGR